MPDWLSNALQYVFDFSNVLNASISASWLVLVVIALRVVLKKAPKWTHVALWGIVALRIMMPFSIESVFSLIPSTQTVSDQLLQAGPVPGTQPAYLEIVTNPSFGRAVTVELSQSISSFQWDLVFMVFIWMAGMVLMTGYTLISYWRLQRRVNTATILRENIFQSEYVGSPFVLGIIKPRIYLPYGMDGQDMEHVIAHEQAHIRRKDHWWKPLGFLLLAIHWFNPLMWLAYVLLCRDIELACDEKVIKDLGNEQRADYTQALVVCSVNRRMIAACPLAFGEIGVKARVKSVMNYRKPAFWIIILAIIAYVIVAVCFLTNPITIGDHFVLTNSDSPANTNKLEYDVHLGNQVMSGEIYVEQWIDGTCVKSAPVVMTQYVDSIEITMRDRREDGTSVGTDVQIETNQYGGSLLTYFAHPENLNVIGWGFKGYELDEKNKLTSNDEVILAAKVFDGGSGIRTFDCETLVAEPERIEDAAYMIVVRAVFSEDPLGVTYQGEASLPVEVLTLNDVIILSQKGYDLTWSDFEQYYYVETGSGLYIRVYEINELLELWIGGAGPDSDPMYIYLTLADDIDTKIDIRDGGVEDFISEYYASYMQKQTLYRDMADPLVCYAESEGMISYIEPKYFSNGFDWDYDHLAWGEMQSSGKLVFKANWDAEELNIREEYYERNGTTSTMRYKEHTLSKNADGKFELDVTYKNPGEEETAVYFIEGRPGEFVMKIVFGAAAYDPTAAPEIVIQKNGVSETVRDKQILIENVIPGRVITEQSDGFGITVPDEWINRDEDVYQPAPSIDTDPEFSIVIDDKSLLQTLIPHSILSEADR